MQLLQLQPAYILHRRAYRESSFLIEFFTQEFGRISAVAKGARKPNSQYLGLLQPFTPLLISCMGTPGQSDLLLMTQVELDGQVAPLQGECLFAGFYLNELLLYLLQKWYPSPSLFKRYRDTLTLLQGMFLDQKILRSFELYLLEILGYRPLPKSVNSLHNSFLAEHYYRFISEQGFVVCPHQEEVTHHTIFSGKNLIAIGKEDWQEEETLLAAKRLTRLLLAPLLGNKQIHSRRLFTPLKEGNNESQ